jgi:hypothetical protein
VRACPDCGVRLSPQRTERCGNVVVRFYRCRSCGAGGKTTQACERESEIVKTSKLDASLRGSPPVRARGS